MIGRLADAAWCAIGGHRPVVARAVGDHVTTVCERCGRFAPIGDIVYSRGDYVWTTRRSNQTTIARFDESAVAQIRERRYFRLFVGNVGTTPFIVDVRTPDDIYSGSET